MLTQCHPLRVLVGLVLLTGRATASEPDTYQGTVLPFLKQHCVKCHGPKKQKGKLALHDVQGSLPKGDTNSAQKWQTVRERLILNEMPPASEPRPNALEIQKVIRWIEATLSNAGVSASPVDRKLLLPGNGNRVDHNALFSGTIRGPVASPARVWRMSPQSYLSFLPRISRIPPRKADYRAKARGQKAPSRFAQPFSGASAHGFQDYSDLFAIDEPTVIQLIRNARQIVEVQTTRPTHRGGRDRRVKEFLPLVNPKTPPTIEQTETAIRKQFHLVLLREPTKEDMQRFLKLAKKNVNRAGQVIGTKYTLTTILMLPEALYRVELGTGTTDKHGRRMLSPRELAYAIAFALTDDPPDPTLLKAATSGKLTTREDVRREVQRILNDKSIAKPRILRFFEEYFEFPAVAEVFKDLPRVTDVFNDVGGSLGRSPLLWRPHVLVTDTRHLIQYVLDQDRDVLKELLTTNKSFVNYGYDEKKKRPGPAIRYLKGHAPKLGYFYGLPRDWEWTAEQPIELSPEDHAGILTQPSWLAAFATNDENHAIRRGKWIRERLLGGVIPDVPITVDAQLPQAPEKTLRQRMEITRDQACWRCHQQMNPIGLVFESYDFLGHFRKTERVLDPNPPKVEVPRNKQRPPPKPAFREVPIDSTGVIENSGDPKLDGPVKNTVELMHKLAKSPRVRQVFVRHAFRYWMGRNETLSEAPVLLAADEAYVKSGGSMKALITSLLTSDAFLYRKETRQGTSEP